MPDQPASPAPDDAARLAAKTVVRVVAFIASSSPSGRRTADTLRTMASEVDGVYLDLDVVDVLEHADRAELDRIIATPTVIREDPLPRVRLVGDLSAMHERDEIARMLFDT